MEKLKVILHVLAGVFLALVTTMFLQRLDIVIAEALPWLWGFHPVSGLVQVMAFYLMFELVWARRGH